MRGVDVDSPYNVGIVDVDEIVSQFDNIHEFVFSPVGKSSPGQWSWFSSSISYSPDDPLGWVPHFHLKCKDDGDEDVDPDHPGSSPHYPQEDVHVHAQDYDGPRWAADDDDY